MNKQMTPAEIELVQQSFARPDPISDKAALVVKSSMATAAEHSRRYRAGRHDDEIVPWSRCRRDTPAAGARHDHRTTKGVPSGYRSRIVGWYDGYIHILIIYAMGAAAFYIYVAHVHNVTWLEWLTLPLTFLFTNIFEWAVHRFIVRRPVNIKGLRAIYERHTLNHHQFFTDEEMRFRDPKDWRVTVFPPYALVVFILMSIPMAVVLGLLLTPNVGWLFMCVTTGMYLIYEFMHFCCHVDENWFVRHCRSSTRCAGITPLTTTRG